MIEVCKWDTNELALIKRVIAIFHDRYPKWMSDVVIPYIEQLENQQGFQLFNFTLLYGETQQGKTMIIHLLSWILIWNTRGYSHVPCYITKDITSLRDDTIDKLARGAINDM